jgi:hypothetical protein
MLEYLRTSHTPGFSPTPTVSRQPRGPKPATVTHNAIADVVAPYGDEWKKEKNLSQIARQLDTDGVPTRNSWKQRKPPARSWRRALLNYPELVIKAIGYSLRMAQRNKQPSQSYNSGNSG